ncbi:MAG: nucleotidyltransferase [Clostridia bacterium]|nr:nucleotidyltransferase [Clostridia bacterium]
MKATLVFLAAGFGSRFVGGVKQLEPIGPNGEVLMDYAVHDALRAGFNRVVFIIRKDLEQVFRAGVGGRVEKKCDVEYVFQDINDLPAGFSVPEGRTKPWGTGQAVLACRNAVREPFCVLNADDYYGPEAFSQIYSCLDAAQPGGKMQCCMAGYVLGNTLSSSGAVTRGLCRVDARGELLAIHEQRGIVKENGRVGVRDGDIFEPLDADIPVSMNIWGMPPEFIGYLEEEFPKFLREIPDGELKAEFLLPTAVGRMIDEGRGSVQVLRSRDRWFGMTYAEDRAEAKEKIFSLIRQGIYPEKI